MKYCYAVTVRHKEKTRGSFCYQTTFHVSTETMNLYEALQQGVGFITGNASYHCGEVIGVVYIGQHIA